VRIGELALHHNGVVARQPGKLEAATGDLGLQRHIVERHADQALRAHLEKGGGALLRGEPHGGDARECL
jgi:hypothetical protein